MAEGIEGVNEGRLLRENVEGKKKGEGMLGLGALYSPGEFLEEVGPEGSFDADLSKAWPGLCGVDFKFGGKSHSSSKHGDPGPHYH